MGSRDRRQRTGELGEEIACEALLRRGYEIIERNWRTTPSASGVARRGEIDIVARDGEFWVFVEVKTRHGRAFALPEDSVTARKKHQLRSLALAYLGLHDLGEVNWRIDLVAIELDRTDAVTDLRLISGLRAE